MNPINWAEITEALNRAGTEHKHSGHEAIQSGAVNACPICIANELAKAKARIAKLVPPGEDTKRLNWLIEHGYVPAEWRALTSNDPPSMASDNGMVFVGRGTRRTIDKAMRRTKNTKS